jgi:8-oxo-dGTP diphosphatase
LTHPATADVRWWTIETTPALAFDHRDLIDTALQRLRSKVAWQPIGVDLLPERFTLSDLQGVYELILGRRLDKRNFRRKIIKLNVLVATDQFRHDNHRPAQLFRFDKERYDRLCAAGIAFEL